jgi:hypothetical protein
MKRILILMTGLFLFGACNNAGEKSAEKKVKYSDLASENLKGDIESIEETPFKVDSSGKASAMDSCCIWLSMYDENGNEIKYFSKDSKGTLKDESVIARHENGLWIGSTDTKDGGKPAGSMKVGVDEKGQYTVAQAFDSTGKLEFYYTFKGPNEYGQLMGWKQYDKDSVFRQEAEQKFDKNLFTGGTSKDSVGKVKSYSAVKYNEKGERTESSFTTVTKDSTTTKVTKYTYDAHDEKGNWTQRTKFDDKGKATKITKRVYVYRKEEVKK